MSKYHLSFVYDTFVITTTEVAGNEDMAIDDAINNLKYELGAGVEDYNSVEINEEEEN